MKCKTCGTDHRGVAKHGGYCLDHQERRAEAAEARAASKSELIDIIIATWEQMTERLLDSEAQRNTAWSELREIREAIHADENEATSDEVRRVVAELARKLEQAQRVCAYWLEDGRFLVANSPAHKAAVDMLREVSNYAA